jgi:zinc transporter, ZIP family
MLEAAFWGFLAAVPLLVGAALALLFRFPQRTIGLVMAFGVGVLISASAYDLVGEAYSIGGLYSVSSGLAAGSLAFFIGNLIINRSGGRDRKRSTGPMKGGSPYAIVLGAVLDGIPESVAIGITVRAGLGVGLALLIGVCLSNFPESLSATTGFRAANHLARYSLWIWAGVLVVSVAAAIAGYSLVGGASDTFIGFSQAFAGGAILTMLADTMAPEAFEDSGDLVGLVTVIGFGLAFTISVMQ